jgi:hypothetical protein
LQGSDEAGPKSIARSGLLARCSLFWRYYDGWPSILKQSAAVSEHSGSRLQTIFMPPETALAAAIAFFLALASFVFGAEPTAIEQNIEADIIVPGCERKRLYLDAPDGYTIYDAQFGKTAIFFSKDMIRTTGSGERIEITHHYLAGADQRDHEALRKEIEATYSLLLKNKDSVLF